MGKFLIILAAFAFALPAAVHPNADAIAAAAENALSQEQQVKIAELVTRDARPLSHVDFSVAVDTVVPPDIQV